VFVEESKVGIGVGEDTPGTFVNNNVADVGDVSSSKACVGVFVLVAVIDATGVSVCVGV
jgi:hypothetical protein